MGRRAKQAIAALAFIALLFAGLAFIVSDTPTEHRAQNPTPTAKDRPVLETPQQCWQARSTGVAEFDFDGVHYVVKGLPKEYVDYSCWYVRMP